MTLRKSSLFIFSHIHYRFFRAVTFFRVFPPMRRLM